MGPGQPTSHDHLAVGSLKREFVARNEQKSLERQNEAKGQLPWQPGQQRWKVCHGRSQNKVNKWSNTCFIF